MDVNCGAVPLFAPFVHIFLMRFADAIIQSGGAGVKRLVTVVTLAILPVGLVLLGLSDTDISVAGSNIPDNEVTFNGANNASATTTITITMTGVLNE